MLRGKDVEEIEQLRREGLSVKRISHLLGIDRKTVRKYLGGPRVPRYGPRLAASSLLSAHEEYIKERLAAGVWNGRVMLRELRDRGYAGQYTILSDYLRPMRREAEHVAVRRFETPPGKQAQVDWGILGDIVLRDGTRLVLSGFVMTLGCSRAMYFDIATDQTLATLMRMHEQAFDALGGMPEQILYDNMKTVVLGRDARGETVFNPGLRDFAGYWGFTPLLCRPYRPQTKGKIESSIGYVRKNFLCGRTADDLEDLRRQAVAWCAQVANVRVHGTTHRVVSESWREERPHLQVLPVQKPYVYLAQELRQISRDAFVQFDASRYSVPWPLAGREVTVLSQDGQLQIWCCGKTVALHELSATKHATIVAPGHHEGIPLGGSARKAKPMLHLTVTEAPSVEVRSLSVYESLAQGGGL